MRVLLQELQAAIEPHLQAIEKLLPPAYKLTLVARNPERPNADIVLTLDGIQNVIDALRGLPGVSLGGAEQIGTERLRQVQEEGYAPEHDDVHTSDELIFGAIAYLDVATGASRNVAATNWAWDRESFKPTTDPIRNRVKAGAMIAADIDRLLRLKLRDGVALESEGGKGV